MKSVGHGALNGYKNGKIYFGFEYVNFAWYVVLQMLMFKI